MFQVPVRVSKIQKTVLEVLGEELGAGFDAMISERLSDWVFPGGVREADCEHLCVICVSGYQRGVLRFGC